MPAVHLVAADRRAVQRDRVPKDSPSRRRIFVCQPASNAEETACATKILSTFARRAYRRPATDEDVQVLLGFYKTRPCRRQLRCRHSRRARARPRQSRFSVPDRSRSRQRRSEFASIASPTSNWLRACRSSCGAASRTTNCSTWRSRENCETPASSIGRCGACSQTRAREPSLVENFFEQWLETRNVWLLTPDANQHFPWFDDNLRIAFVKEMDLFLDAQLKEDRSIVDLLTSNFTFLNEQLARHYGIAGVYGSHFRRVTLTDENRWGLLGKAAVLAVTSYTTRTSPTIRGKWLLENILGAPVPPPPPNIPALEASNKGDKPLSVREMLETHRKNPVCASCHARMDPLGFSLENFDAHRAVAHNGCRRGRSTRPACCWTERKSKGPRRCDRRW